MFYKGIVWQKEQIRVEENTWIDRLCNTDMMITIINYDSKVKY